MDEKKQHKVVDLDGNPFGEEEPKDFNIPAKMVARYDLTTQPHQVVELPASLDPMLNPSLLGMIVTEGGDRSTLIRAGYKPAILVSITTENPAPKIAAINIYCVKSGEDIPEATGYMGTATIDKIDYHYFS